MNVYKVKFTRSFVEEGYELVAAESETDAIAKAESFDFVEYDDIIDSAYDTEIVETFEGRDLPSRVDDKNIAWYAPGIGLILGVDGGLGAIHSYRVAMPKDLP